MGVPERIVECRKALGMNQAELAERIGLEQSMVSRMEHGKRPIMYPEIEKLAEAFGLSVLDFLDFERPVKAILILQERKGEENDRNEG